jgi:hypothetical protein
MEDVSMTSSNPDKETRELHKVYASESAEQTAAVYDGWSADYEAHMNAIGYADNTFVAAVAEVVFTQGHPPPSTVWMSSSGSRDPGDTWCSLSRAPALVKLSSRTPEHWGQQESGNEWMLRIPTIRPLRLMTS